MGYIQGPKGLLENGPGPCPVQPVSVLPHKRICDTQLTAEPAGVKAPGTGLSPSLVAVADS